MKWPLFYHTGCIGDIVAALPTIRALGGGDLAIGNFENPAWQNRRMEGACYESIKPLLEMQDCIKSVRWADEHPAATYDFADFRQGFIRGESLAHWQARYMGVGITTEPWLVNIAPDPRTRDRIIATRSARYHNWSFPWPQIVKENRDRILFVGLRSEHEALQKLVGPLEYFPTLHMLDVACAIAGSDLLISNQTAACWIGLGLGHPLVQEQYAETPDSMLPRANAQYCQYHGMPVIPPRKAISIAQKTKQDIQPLVKSVRW